MILENTNILSFFNLLSVLVVVASFILIEIVDSLVVSLSMKNKNVVTVHFIESMVINGLCIAMTL